MKAKVIQICGTGSGVGKSVIAAGLCRIFLQDGFKVAPFKAQNMSLNSAVTRDGLEIGRAQAMQAEACKIEPSVDMNPILLKPTSDVGSQVIVRGKPLKNMNVGEYHDYKHEAFKIVKSSINKLMSQYEIVVIEGAGSPAEINLKSNDIVNMKIASLVRAPVILAGDIDRGGVFAWFVGTLELLEESEKRLIKGFIINKFRGDKRLLDKGLSFLEKKTNKKVLGVIPYFKDIKLPEEDSLFFDKKKDISLKNEINSSSASGSGINIVIIKLPHISNFTDFACLEQEKEVFIEYTTESDKIKRADCIIIPGTKSTLSDLEFLCNRGLANIIRKKAKDGAHIIGICGGYQMLGKKIFDAQKVESEKKVIGGLSLLNVETEFSKEKKTFQVEGVNVKTQLAVKGYEIHHGLTKRYGALKPSFLIEKRSNKNVCIEDGAQNHNGRIWGTYIHGIFDNSDFRRWVINKIRKEKGLEPLEREEEYFSQDKEYDKLARILRSNLDMKFLYNILEA